MERNLGRQIENTISYTQKGLNFIRTKLLQTGRCSQDTSRNQLIHQENNFLPKSKCHKLDRMKNHKNFLGSTALGSSLVNKMDMTKGRESSRTDSKVFRIHSMRQLEQINIENRIRQKHQFRIQTQQKEFNCKTEVEQCSGEMRLVLREWNKEQELQKKRKVRKVMGLYQNKYFNFRG